MPNGVFRAWTRENRPLSFHLRQRFLQPQMRRIEGMSYEHLHTDLDDLARQLADAVRVQPPVLLGQERAGAREGEWRPGSQAGTRVPTIRYYTAIEVEGDLEVLEHWPDDAEQTDQLRPVDDGMDDWTSLHGPGGSPYDYPAELLWYEALLAQDRWSVSERTHGGPWALFTFVELTEDEREQVEAGRRHPAAEVTAALEQVRPIVLALADQMQRFFDRDLPAHFGEELRRRRRQLSAHQAVLDSLTFPTKWKNPAPVLEPVPDRPSPAAEPSADVALGRPTRLSDASFGDLLRTVRVWANAVEGHPLAYRTLPEERVSDLLAATLNAALPGAGREVYNRGGKTDIYVRADTLASGVAPARVFVCECKWWSGASDASQALTQLFGYLDARDTAAVLLFLVRLRVPSKARGDAQSALQDRVEYVGMEAEQVEGWPVMRFDRHGATARVCVVFVDLPDLDGTGATADQVNIAPDGEDPR